MYIVVTQNRGNDHFGRRMVEVDYDNLKYLTWIIYMYKYMYR